LANFGISKLILEEGPPTAKSHFVKTLMSWGMALSQKRHSFGWVMKLALNVDAEDLMKRTPWLVQGF